MATAATAAAAAATVAVGWAATVYQTALPMWLLINHFRIMHRGETIHCRLEEVGRGVGGEGGEITVAAVIRAVIVCSESPWRPYYSLYSKTLVV